MYSASACELRSGRVLAWTMWAIACFVCVVQRVRCGCCWRAICSCSASCSPTRASWSRSTRASTRPAWATCESSAPPPRRTSGSPASSSVLLPTRTRASWFSSIEYRLLVRYDVAGCGEVLGGLCFGLLGRFTNRLGRDPIGASPLPLPLPLPRPLRPSASRLTRGPVFSFACAVWTQCSSASCAMWACSRSPTYSCRPTHRSRRTQRIPTRRTPTSRPSTSYLNLYEYE